MDTDLKGLEREIIGHVRAAIAHLNTDLSVVNKNMNAAHELFSDHLMEWSEEFATLYNGMLAIYRAHRPLLKGHYCNTHSGIGYSSFPINRWVADKEQPVPPTAIELVVRFDRLVSANTSSEEAAECFKVLASWQEVL